MRFVDLLEKRRNPDHPSQKIDKNPDGSTMSPDDFLKKYAELDKFDIYVSFQALPKLGFNPKLENGGTPAGVYGYPLSAYRSKLTRHSGDYKNVFEYGYMRPFLFAFKTTERLTDVEKYTEEELMNDIELMSNMLYDSGFEDSSGSLLHEIDKMQHEGNSSIGAQLTNLPFHLLWAGSWIVANKLYNKESDDVSSVYTSKFAYKWAKVLLDLGHVGFVDKSNQYLIHEGEKSQVAILKPSIIKVIDVHKSKSTYSGDFEGDVYSKKMKKISNPKDRKLMNKYFGADQNTKFKILAAFGNLGIFNDIWAKMSVDDKVRILDVSIDNNIFANHLYQIMERSTLRKVFSRTDDKFNKWFETHMDAVSFWFNGDFWMDIFRHEGKHLVDVILSKRDDLINRGVSFSFLDAAQKVKKEMVDKNENK